MLKRLALALSIIGLSIIGAAPPAPEALANVCNPPSGWLIQNGQINTGNVVIFGPDCAQVSDGGTAPGFGTPTNTIQSYSANATMSANDCTKTVNLTGSAFYTFTVAAPASYNAKCQAIILNGDNGCPNNGAATCRGKLLKVSGFADFILWPGQQIYLVSIGGAAWRFDMPPPWAVPANVYFYVCHSSGAKTFASVAGGGSGTSGAGMIPSDTQNDGMGIDAPWATIQNAINTFAGFEWNNHSNAIQQCNETFTENVNDNRVTVGNHIDYIQGDTTTPANVTWACGNGGICANARDFGIMVISGVRWCANTSCSNAASAGAVALMASQWGNIDYQNVTFGHFVGGSHIQVLQGGGINFTGTAYSITGSANQHWYMQGPAHLVIGGGGTITVSGGLTITNFLETHSAGSTFSIVATTFAGAGAGAGTTGSQYNVEYFTTAGFNGVTLPGATAGAFTVMPCNFLPALTGGQAVNSAGTCSVTINAPAANITGTTLASNVVTTSIATVGQTLTVNTSGAGTTSNTKICQDAAHTTYSMLDFKASCTAASAVGWLGGGGSDTTVYLVGGGPIGLLSDKSSDVGTSSLRFNNVWTYNVSTKAVTVASLPTCNGTNEGMRGGVTDANSTTFNAAAAGGGANHMSVYCNGTGWVLQ